ncbi:hypothetical protein ACOSQ2_003205 [Xanthoceras sorbifolium]
MEEAQVKAFLAQKQIQVAELVRKCSQTSYFFNANAHNPGISAHGRVKESAPPSSSFTRWNLIFGKIIFGHILNEKLVPGELPWADPRPLTVLEDEINQVSLDPQQWIQFPLPGRRVIQRDLSFIVALIQQPFNKEGGTTRRIHIRNRQHEHKRNLELRIETKRTTSILGAEVYEEWLFGPFRPVVRTSSFHVEDTGSIPVRDSLRLVAKLKRSTVLRPTFFIKRLEAKALLNERDAGSVNCIRGVTNGILSSLCRRLINERRLIEMAFVPVNLYPILQVEEAKHRNESSDQVPEEMVDSESGLEVNDLPKSTSEVTSFSTGTEVKCSHDGLFLNRSSSCSSSFSEVDSAASVTSMVSLCIAGSNPEMDSCGPVSGLKPGVKELSPAVSLTRTGLPRIIPSFHRKMIRRRDAKQRLTG